MSLSISRAIAYELPTITPQIIGAIKNKKIRQKFAGTLKNIFKHEVNGRT